MGNFASIPSQTSASPALLLQYIRQTEESQRSEKRPVRDLLRHLRSPRDSHRNAAIAELDLMLRLLGVNREDFYCSLRESSDPEEALKCTLKDFAIFLDAPTASSKVFENLQQIDVEIDGSMPRENICNVCHDKYVEKDVLKELPCGHSFHSVCIGRWLWHHRTCPVCRFEV